MQNSNLEIVSAIKNEPAQKKSKNKRWFKKGTRFAIVPETLLFDPSLSNTDKVIIMALALHHNYQFGTCTPSRETLSKICGLSLNKISEATGRLKKLGWLDTQRRGSTSSQFILKDPNFTIEDIELSAKNTPKTYKAIKPTPSHYFNSTKFNEADFEEYDIDF